MPTAQEIADVLEMQEYEVKDLITNNQRHVSLDEKVEDNDDGPTRLENHNDKDQKLADYGLYMESLNKDIVAALSLLSRREKEVIELYYGVNKQTAHTLDEIGTLFDLTRERVRQIKETGIRKLKNPGRSKRLKGYLGQ
jgi:RNA polymerase primary sigma factor